MQMCCRTGKYTAGAVKWLKTKMFHKVSRKLQNNNKQQQQQNTLYKTVECQCCFYLLCSQLLSSGSKITNLSSLMSTKLAMCQCCFHLLCCQFNVVFRIEVNQLKFIYVNKVGNVLVLILFTLLPVVLLRIKANQLNFIYVNKLAIFT